MSKVTIGGQVFQVVPFKREDARKYRDYLDRVAKAEDQPIERFIRTKCVNLTREERQDVLIAWMQVPGWDNPPDTLVRKCAHYLPAVALLAGWVLRPERSFDEWQALIGKDTKAIYDAICEALQPRDDAEEADVDQATSSPVESEPVSESPTDAKATDPGQPAA